ncbi:MAG: hypothetical protein PHQ81_10360 [Methanofollis sp.]|nr:hypothetical protein [Methanofollis sp.]
MYGPKSAWLYCSTAWQDFFGKGFFPEDQSAFKNVAMQYVPT